MLHFRKAHEIQPSSALPVAFTIIDQYVKPMPEPRIFIPANIQIPILDAAITVENPSVDNSRNPFKILIEEVRQAPDSDVRMIYFRLWFIVVNGIVYSH